MNCGASLTLIMYVVVEGVDGLRPVQLWKHVLRLDREPRLIVSDDIAEPHAIVVATVVGVVKLL